jgi:molybdopterin synthase sulfur carrier subunit
MAKVNFTSLLKRFYPDLTPLELEGTTVAELLQNLEHQHEGITDYLVEENGKLRKHVNIFVNGEMVDDRIKLSDALTPQSEVYIMQALSGG